MVVSEALQLYKMQLRKKHMTTVCKMRGEMRKDERVPTFANVEMDWKLDLFVCNLLTSAALVIDEALEVEN